MRLAEALECSTRTVQRILQTLSMAGVPVRYDPELRAYRLPPKFKFPGLEVSPEINPRSVDLTKMRSTAKRVIQDGEDFLESLRDFCELLEGE
jgi:predicted DNA-binding transcriptional regulator YafY